MAHSENSDLGRESVLNMLAEVACLGASYQSDKIFNLPKCLPETRVNILSEIMTWVNSEDPKERKVRWLKGSAGAGKSTICQSIAEMCLQHKKLASSFFFKQTTTRAGRDDGNRLIPTIVYHLATAIPEIKDDIVKKLEKNPAILQYSMNEQMKNLIVEPIARLSKASTPPKPALVIIDALDECTDPKVQITILKLILETLVQSPAIHLRFLIASRPEIAIRQVLELPSFHDVFARLTLDERNNHTQDIELYTMDDLDSEPEVMHSRQGSVGLSPEEDPEGEHQAYTTPTESRARQPVSTSQRTEDGHTLGPSVYANGVLAGASNIVMNNPHLTDITYNGPADAVSASIAVKMASLSAIAAASVTANVALYRELCREQSISEGTSGARISNSSATPTDCSIGDTDNFMQDPNAYTTLTGVVNMLSGGQSQPCLQINGTSGTTQYFLGGFDHLESIGDAPPVASTFTLLMCITNSKFKVRKTGRTVQASSVVL